MRLGVSGIPLEAAMVCMACVGIAACLVAAFTVTGWPTLAVIVGGAALLSRAGREGRKPV